MYKKASILIIGNEILSGKTQDKNTNFLAKKFTSLGIDLMEVRIIPDIKKEIIYAVNSLRKKYDYLFTTGGIGPTHDDITAESISEAFNVPLEQNEIAYNLIKNFYESRGDKLNSFREKMSYIPKSAELINNDITKAPGFQIDNVFVLAGVPEILHNMFDYLEEKLEKGKKIINRSIKIYTGESDIADILTTLQKKYYDIDIGSYPYKNIKTDNSIVYLTEVVFKGRNEDSINLANEELLKNIAKRNIEFENNM